MAPLSAKKIQRDQPASRSPAKSTQKDSIRPSKACNWPWRQQERMDWKVKGGRGEWSKETVGRTCWVVVGVSRRYGMGPREWGCRGCGSAVAAAVVSRWGPPRHRCQFKPGARRQNTQKRTAPPPNPPRPGRSTDACILQSIAHMVLLSGSSSKPLRRQRRV